MSCEKIGEVVEVPTQVDSKYMKEAMSVGSRGFKVLHTLSRAPISACITSDHVLNQETDVDKPNSTAACYQYIIYLYTIVSSIVLNIIEINFRTNVRFPIFVRHGRLSEKLISVVGQMSVSDKCPRIYC